MNTRHFLTCAAIVGSIFWGALPACGIELTWRVGNEWDNLLINNVEIASSPTSSVQAMEAKFQAVGVDGSRPLKVTFPVNADGLQMPRLPRLPGILAQVFEALTKPDREVTYVFEGRQLRRYQIVCSSKGTAESPEHAHYWLDGEFLGTWKEARPRLLSVQWEENAVVEMLFDRENFLTASGGGLYILPKLSDLFRKHRITVNQHWRQREAGDR